MSTIENANCFFFVLAQVAEEKDKKLALPAVYLFQSAKISAMSSNGTTWKVIDPHLFQCSCHKMLIKKK